MIIYYIKKIKYILVILVIGLIVSIFIYNKWNDSLIKTNEFDTYILNNINNGSVELKIANANYNFLVEFLEKSLPKYFDYDIKFISNILSLNVKVKILPDKKELDNIYHSNYERYLEVKEQMISNGIAQEENFDSNNKYIDG